MELVNNHRINKHKVNIHICLLRPFIYVYYAPFNILIYNINNHVYSNDSA